MAREGGGRNEARWRAVQFATGVNAGAGNLGISETWQDYAYRTALRGSSEGLVSIHAETDSTREEVDGVLEE